MHVREYTPADLKHLVGIYERQGFKYRFPDLDEPATSARFISKLVLEDGRPVASVLARATAEIYLLLDPTYGTPEQRWEAFEAIHRAAETSLLDIGLEDSHCWLPPAIERRFGKRLATLGWTKDNDWTPYCKYLVRPTEPQVLEEPDGQR